ncbi:hypothetical protein VSDG_00470 [Cytospora chrysosperma]|uniref:Uncharacterized protein n=1 Tax=Cytospora chrysosperma TaxID=252740 RepID=A0A423WP29_CYTCH|nr:hypothetical protein VSDG_00470 [Valsa sordida]
MWCMVFGSLAAGAQLSNEDANGRSPDLNGSSFRVTCACNGQLCTQDVGFGSAGSVGGGGVILYW